MKLSTDPGIVFSGAGHVVLLIAMLVAFSDTKQFEDAQESVPVEMVTDQQFAQIMKGTKTEKEVKPQPVRVDKVADIPDTHPTPPVVEAKTDVPAPPPRLRRIPDPGQDDVPLPPQRVAALPPTPPSPAPPQRPTDPPKAEAKPEPPPKPDAEAIAPPPRPKDEPKKAAATPPLPPVPVRPDQAKPKPDNKLKLDEVAKLIEATKTDKAAAKPKSGDETADPKQRLNPSEISQFLSHEAPQTKASTGRELSQIASLGSPTASAPKMSPSLWGQLDGLMMQQYLECWNNLGLSDEYIPEIHVEFTPDGALAAAPILINPPSDATQRSRAEGAMRAVQRCNPLKIPAQFAPYYKEWKERNVRFDREQMAE